jgi:hypothetical protein
MFAKSTRKSLLLKSKIDLKGLQRAIALGEYELKIQHIKKYLVKKGFVVEEVESDCRVRLRKEFNSTTSIELNYLLDNAVKQPLTTCEVLINRRASDSQVLTLQTFLQFEMNRETEISSAVVFKRHLASMTTQQSNKLGLNSANIAYERKKRDFSETSKFQVIVIYPNSFLPDIIIESGWYVQMAFNFWDRRTCVPMHKVSHEIHDCNIQ